MIEFVSTKKNYIMALAILFVLVSLSGPTYSLFLKADSTNSFSYNTGLLDLEFIEDEQIVIENAFPIIDSEGVKQDAYTLTIKNTGSLPYIFNLKMLSDTDDNVIDTKYIKVQVNEQLPHTLYSTSGIIASNLIIYPDEEKTFKIKTWLDINTPNNELGKVFVAKVVTEGSSIYKTLDSSGANHPKNTDNLIAVYYDKESETWNKADNSNTITSYKWYDYDNQMWANAVSIKDSSKQIYDITRNYNIKIDEVSSNNGNIIIDDNYLELPINNYGYSLISNIFRIKFDDLNDDYIYIISNDNMSYYYDVKNKQFIFKLNNQTVSSKVYEVTENTWYILGYTYNSNQISFYVNGTYLSKSNLNGTINSSSYFKVGANYSGNKISKITVGDIYIYKDILSDSEIKNNYGDSINIIENNLIAGYNTFIPMTLSEYYLSADNGTVINNEDISSQYVWIPRFKYKLWNVTGEENIDSYDAYHTGIDISFEKDNATTGVIFCENLDCYSDSLLITKVTQSDNGKYYTHPAFSNLSDEVTGLWVSKYEVSTNSSSCNEELRDGCLSSSLTVESKANNYTWTNNYLSNYYQAIKKINSDINYHMIKNSEWGAISYLAHSKYGVCQNNKCSDIEGNNTYIQGSEIKDSTTNNIYGVFDMAGGASEFVMANYADDNGDINITDTHFQNIPIVNSDYDLYYSNKFILGDATRELSITGGIWYNSTSKMIDNTNRWFIRGGIANQDNGGIFYYNATTDTNSEYISTRIVIK